MGGALTTLLYALALVVVPLVVIAPILLLVRLDGDAADGGEYPGPDSTGRVATPHATTTGEADPTRPAEGRVRCPSCGAANDRTYTYCRACADRLSTY
ncbi:hypothetical protein BRD17_01550 [Halobacteriales archaeon SW_7_68_16]|nr:MAG: hypothetical protein BRD17_01550 [Halobacteriales archaeon SW_7_68_16]